MAQAQMAPRRGDGYSAGVRIPWHQRRYLYRYASEGFIPAFKLGNRWRFKKSLLDTWMDEKSGVKPQVPTVVAPKQKKPAGRAR